MSTIVYLQEFASEDYADVKFELSHSRVYYRDLVSLMPRVLTSQVSGYARMAESSYTMLAA